MGRNIPLTMENIEVVLGQPRGLRIAALKEVLARDEDFMAPVLSEAIADSLNYYDGENQIMRAFWSRHKKRCEVENQIPYECTRPLREENICIGGAAHADITDSVHDPTY